MFSPYPPVTEDVQNSSSFFSAAAQPTEQMWVVYEQLKQKISQQSYARCCVTTWHPKTLKIQAASDRSFLLYKLLDTHIV